MNFRTGHISYSKVSRKLCFVPAVFGDNEIKNGNYFKKLRINKFVDIIWQLTNVIILTGIFISISNFLIKGFCFYRTNLRKR